MVSGTVYTHLAALWQLMAGLGPTRPSSPTCQCCQKLRGTLLVKRIGWLVLCCGRAKQGHFAVALQQSKKTTKEKKHFSVSHLRTDVWSNNYVYISRACVIPLIRLLSFSPSLFLHISTHTHTDTCTHTHRNSGYLVSWWQIFNN